MIVEKLQQRQRTAVVVEKVKLCCNLCSFVQATGKGTRKWLLVVRPRI
jgi:hypothetical protein